MKRMLNRMLRYADAIVKRGVDKLIDAIGHQDSESLRRGKGHCCGYRHRHLYRS